MSTEVRYFKESIHAGYSHDISSDSEGDEKNDRISLITPSMRGMKVSQKSGVSRQVERGTIAEVNEQRIDQRSASRLPTPSRVEYRKSPENSEASVRLITEDSNKSISDVCILSLNDYPSCASRNEHESGQSVTVCLEKKEVLQSPPHSLHEHQKVTVQDHCHLSPNWKPDKLFVSITSGYEYILSQLFERKDISEAKEDKRVNPAFIHTTGNFNLGNKTRCVINIGAETVSIERQSKNKSSTGLSPDDLDTIKAFLKTLDKDGICYRLTSIRPCTEAANHQEPHSTRATLTFAIGAKPIDLPWLNSMQALENQVRQLAEQCFTRENPGLLGNWKSIFCGVQQGALSI
ncbi:hypothetical protein [Endozoicomonas sp.]|uniref:hypothetical protein n=1 Tax=Endozoicomonas sp. TaxID=1892382 RepID=UPI003AF61195